LRINQPKTAQSDELLCLRSQTFNSAIKQKNGKEQSVHFYYSPKLTLVAGCLTANAFEVSKFNHLDSLARFSLLIPYETKTKPFSPIFADCDGCVALPKFGQ
jgi:hypothetical protein